MTVVKTSRECPICKQIVPSHVQEISVKIFPRETVCLHQGCAERVHEAWQTFNDQKIVKPESSDMDKIATEEETEEEEEE